MILNNVPPEDLLANTRGICNGSFNIVMKAAATVRPPSTT